MCKNTELRSYYNRNKRTSPYNPESITPECFVQGQAFALLYTLYQLFQPYGEIIAKNLLPFALQDKLIADKVFSFTVLYDI